MGVKKDILSQKDATSAVSKSDTMIKVFLKNIAKTLLYAILAIAAVSIVSGVVSLIMHRRIELSLVILWNYVASAIIIFFGIIVCLGVGPEKKKGVDIAARLPLAALSVDGTSGLQRNPWILVMGFICMVSTGLVEVLTWKM